MLSEIYIRNLAVIDRAEIRFSMGLNIFTGETGAGKSIVVDAINAVLGQRVSREVIRTGSDKAVISGVFDELPNEVLDRMAEFGFEPEDGRMIVEREIRSDGKNVARLCGRPVNLSVLREICGDLVNIHGQHDSQVLLSADRHLSVLDSFGDYGSDLEDYQALFSELRETALEVKRLSADEAEKERRKDLLTFQIGEIRAAALSPGEDEAVENELKALRNFSDIADGLSAARQYLSGGDEVEGAVGLLSRAAGELSGAAAHIDSLESLSATLNDVYYSAQDLAERIGSFLDGFEFDPRRLSDLEDRQDAIRRLKKKYGGTVEEILAFAEKAESELDRIENADALLEEYTRKQSELLRKAREMAASLSEKRHAAAKRFLEEVSAELRFLDMPNVVLDAAFTPCRLNRFGLETLEFLISTNLGEPPKPMNRIASGGELSRIMLAIKNVLADKDRIPTLIFDEIDTGVSGRAARKIGLKLKEAARNKQVVCVTHLAQIAALADSHLLIEKKTQGERTFTEVIPLDHDGRVREVARIMGTGKMTELLLQNAEELIRSGES